MPLTPVDGFVLSRVDGESSEGDIMIATGLSGDQVRNSLERLVSLSLVSLVDAPARNSGTVATSGATPRPAAPAPATAPPTPVVTLTLTLTRPLPGTVPDLDLSGEDQLRILAIHGEIDTADHYALLGAARDAVRKDIKRAYYERAAAYHPDRYFRRNVGPFKAKLEAVFGAVTLAHDVLTDKVKRAEYDTYLADVARARELEARVEQAGVPVPVPEEAASPPPTVSGIIAVTPAIAAPNRPSRPSAPIDARARRDLLAKHLTGGRAPPAPATASAPPPSTQGGDPDALRRHFDQRKADVARAQALRHKSAGDQAMASGDIVAAVRSYRSALQFLPEDPELQRLHAETQLASVTALADTYRKQANYEEKSARWSDAAVSWTKLANLLPNDTQAHERAGNAILQAKGSLHDAATYAQRAVALEPGNAEYRKLLATIYLEAGLLKNARRELDAAEQITPGDVSIAALSKRLASATGR